MSDFPQGGDVGATRVWLNENGFVDVLKGWKADAVFGLEKGEILLLVPGEDGLRLCGLLRTARTGNLFLIWNPIFCC